MELIPDDMVRIAFEKAQIDVKFLKKRPANQQLAMLYGYFKQAISGNIQGNRPGFFDVVGRHKYDAWKKCESMSQEQSMQSYVDLVHVLLSDPRLTDIE